MEIVFKTNVVTHASRVGRVHLKLSKISLTTFFSSTISTAQFLQRQESTIDLINLAPFNCSPFFHIDCLHFCKKTTCPCKALRQGSYRISLQIVPCIRLKTVEVSAIQQSNADESMVHAIYTSMYPGVCQILNYSHFDNRIDQRTCKK